MKYRNKYKIIRSAIFQTKGIMPIWGIKSQSTTIYFASQADQSQKLYSQNQTIIVITTCMKNNPKCVFHQFINQGEKKKMEIQ